MRSVKYSFWGLLCLLSVFWLMADTFRPQPFTYFSFRQVFVQYSGVIGIGVMSIAMVLAVRLRWIERLLSGLDKVYRLHKWLGITALVASVLHWWWVTGTKWMVGWGWLIKPARKQQSPQETIPVLEQWLRSQKGLAESVGEWAFYAAVVLLALALIKRFPYRLFRKTHNLIAIVYLVLVFHTLVLMKFEYWSQPVGWLLAVLMLGGVISAVVVLSGRVGHGRKVKGVIESFTHYPHLHVIEGTLKVDGSWLGHKPGQFAFVCSNKREGAHPYTIASAWDPQERTLTFITKALGDWTGQLQHWLREGMPVTVEGPYGFFDFTDHSAHQIWVGAGIGITPFIARMKHLAKEPGAQEIDLFYTTRHYDPVVIDRLNAGAEAAGVRLHLIRTPDDGYLSAERIRNIVPHWREASLWYCGPTALGVALRKDFIAVGLAEADFHQELFEMR